METKKSCTLFNKKYYRNMADSTRQIRPSDEIDEKKFSIRNWLEILLMTILLTLILRAYVFQGYKVPSSSMENTLLIGDYFIAEKITYRMRPPRLGELIVFKYPLNPEKNFIKRCVALPGDTVVIRDKIVYVNGEQFPDPSQIKYTDSRVLSAIYSNRDNFGPRVVPRKSIFVLGDNRDNSQDSRFWGFLPVKNIEARPLFRYYSWAIDSDAPSYDSILDIIPIIFYNIVHFPIRTRWERIGKAIS